LRAFPGGVSESGDGSGGGGANLVDRFFAIVLAAEISCVEAEDLLEIKSGAADLFKRFFGTLVAAVVVVLVLVAEAEGFFEMRAGCD